MKETRTNISSQALVLHQDIKSPDPLGLRNQGNQVAFALEAIYKNGGVFKYPKTFQCDNGSEFKNEVTKLLEKHNVKIRRATTKYKHTHTAFVEAFNKKLTKLLFKPMDAQELQDLEKVLTIWVKNLNKTVNKMNNTLWSTTGIKPKDCIYTRHHSTRQNISRRNRNTQGWII